MSPTINKRHKTAYLYLKLMQFIDLMLGHKKIKLLLFNLFLEILRILVNITNKSNYALNSPQNILLELLLFLLERKQL